jgi:hypothetical protein
MRPPINLHEIRPRPNPIVSPAGAPQRSLDGSFQAAPAPHPRPAPIGSYNPAGGNSSARQLHRTGTDSLHHRLPKKLHPAALCILNKDLVQDRPANPNSLPCGKISSYIHAALHKLNSTKAMALTGRKLDPQRAQRRLRLGHHPFPARLVNRGHRAIG